MLRCSVKSTGYPFHSPVSPSLPFPCVTMCHHISTGLYSICWNLRSSLKLSLNWVMSMNPSKQLLPLLCSALQHTHTFILATALQHTHIHFNHGTSAHTHTHTLILAMAIQHTHAHTHTHTRTHVHNCIFLSDFRENIERNCVFAYIRSKLLLKLFPLSSPAQTWLYWTRSQVSNYVFIFPTKCTCTTLELLGVNCSICISCCVAQLL
jgi:hypothetical protein